MATADNSDISSHDDRDSASVFDISKTVFSLSQSLLKANGGDVGGLLHQSLEALRDEMSAERVWIDEVSRAGESITRYEASADAVETESPSMNAADFATLKAQLEQGRALRFQPGEQIPADTEAAREAARARAEDDLCLFPLVHEGTLKAVFGVQCGPQKELSDSVRTLLEGASGVFLQALVLREVRSALDISQRRYQSLVDSLEEVIFEVDRHGRWVFLSEHWREMTGEAPRQTVGGQMLEAFDEYESTQLEMCLQGHFGGTTSGEIDVRLIAGESDPRWVRLALQPVWDDKGEFDGVRGSIRDASRLRQSVADLQQVDRLVNFGTLAAGIGHELNNPLAFVIGNLDFTASGLRRLDQKLAAVGRRHSDDEGIEDCQALIEDIGDATRDMKDGARRLREIVADLRVFTRVDSDEERVPIDLREPVESAISIGFSEIRHRATLIREFSGQLPPVSVNRGRISQVFLNLLVNAAQAFGQNTDSDNRIWVRLYEEDGWVIAEIEDNGPGISQEQQDRIFEAFFTTKAPSEGTGLGLSICKNLVESEGGAIEVASQPGDGAVFRVRLPAKEGEEPRTQDSSASPSGGLPRLRVLVIDDEPAVSRTIQRMLGQKHELTTVSDARIAVEALRSGQDFDVILCDIIMPRMNGEEFLDIASETFEGLTDRIIFMTGGASMDIVSRMRANATQPILEKPFTRRELRDACINLIRGLMRQAKEQN